MYNTTQKVSDLARLIKTVWYGLILGVGMLTLMAVVAAFGVLAGMNGAV